VTEASVTVTFFRVCPTATISVTVALRSSEEGVPSKLTLSKVTNTAGVLNVLTIFVLLAVDTEAAVQFVGSHRHCNHRHQTEERHL
jgi:hypothetical protein